MCDVRALVVSSWRNWCEFKTCEVRAFVQTHFSFFKRAVWSFFFPPPVCDERSSVFSVFFTLLPVIVVSVICWLKRRKKKSLQRAKSGETRI